MAIFAALEVCDTAEYQTAQTTILFHMHMSVCNMNFLKALAMDCTLMVASNLQSCKCWMLSASELLGATR